MPKSKLRKGHKSRIDKRKSETKKKKEAYNKQMLEWVERIKAQTEANLREKNELEIEKDVE